MSKENKKNIQEMNEYIPQVKSWEVADYENQFREKVHHDVSFDSKGQNGYSMALYKGDSGTEALWSGIIRFQGENHIKWEFSLQNGPFMQSSIVLTEETKNISEKLYDFYIIWRDEWSKILSLPQGAEGSEEESPEQAPEETLQESLRNNPRKTNTIIDNHSSRMKRLAGL